MKDPIVEEVREVRDSHAARFEYDLDAIFRDIKEKEKKSGCRYVSFPPRRAESQPAQQPSPAAVSTAQGWSALQEASSTSAIGPQAEGGNAS